MRKLFILLVLTLVLFSCGTSKYTPEEKAAREAKRTQKVIEAINNQKFIIDMDYVYPKRFRSRHLDFNYSLEVRGDSVISYLPYYGTAYSVPYGGGKALNFSAPMSSYRAYQVKNNRMRVELSAKSEEDTYYFILDVYDNGNTNVDVSSQHRESIGFSGTMQINDEK
jgi:hypothetical protein